MRLRERVEVRQAGMEAGTARIEAGPLFSSVCPRKERRTSSSI